ncbi:uncharacterized protein LOC134448882 [Engraulis encrasicolus]|uniref:uncharacterized protein LOC134448882 n=1 Tax=Engraulis encrasicolus TaxID=184585 RepID=UPI002FCF5054
MAAAGPMFPDEKYVFTIVERSLRTFLQQLMADVLSQLTGDMEEGSSAPPVCSPQTVVEGLNFRPKTMVEGVDLRPQTVMEGVDLSLLITMMSQEVVNTLSRRPRDSSASLTTSLTTHDQENLTNYKARASKERANITNDISVGNDYFSLISAVLMQLLTKIEPTTPDMADFPEFHSGLVEQTLTDFSSASGHSRYEASPGGVSVQRMCNNIYSDLLDVFRNKSMVHGLLVYRQPVLKTVLSQFLVNELVKVCRKGAGAGLFHKLKVNRKLADALKSRLAKGNAKVHPITTKEQACNEDDGEWVSLESSECSSPGSLSSAMQDSTSDLLSKMKRTLHIALSKSHVAPT